MSKPSPSSRSFWVVIAVAVSCGLAAGIFGEMIARTYFMTGLASFSGDVNLSSLNANNSGLIIPNAKTVVVNQDVKTTEVISNIRPVLVSIFKAINPANSSSTTPVSPKLEFYPLDNPLFVGLVITSDGWVIAPVSAEEKNNFKAQNFVAIASDRQLYKIDKVQDLKTASGNLLIFHLADAANLPIKTIIARSDLSLGESLLIINGLNTAQPTTLVSLSHGAELLSSDLPSAALSLDDNVSNKLVNSFVFDLAGNLAAIIMDNGQVTPAFSYNAAWSNLSSKTPSLAPFLGVNYLDLSLVKTPAMISDKGAWLFPSATEPAVLKGSPAELAGLRAGDVITWVNNQPIDASNDLADLISAYRAGDTVTLTYVRAGAEKTINVKLGAFK